MIVVKHHGFAGLEQGLGASARCLVAASFVGTHEFVSPIGRFADILLADVIKPPIEPSKILNHIDQLTLGLL